MDLTEVSGGEVTLFTGGIPAQAIIAQLVFTGRASGLIRSSRAN